LLKHAIYNTSFNIPTTNHTLYLSNSTTSETPSSTPSSDTIVPDTSPSSTTDRFVARVVWGNDPESFVSDVARKESEKEEAVRKKNKDKKGKPKGTK